MAFFYKTAGWYANIALIFNVLLLFGVLVSFGAVLTLPGIAGIVLTMGMAVDANVIIFERIKEELRGGKGIMLAIKDGFANAYSAIIDGNLTTIITGIVLFFFGTGPVKGFATTLIIGIVTSLFCAIFITRVLIESHVARRGAVSFSRKITENFLQNVSFSFISKRKISYIVSGILVVASIISLCTIGLNQGVEFTGGRSYVVKFNETVNIEDVRVSVENVFEGVADAANSSVEVKQFGDDNQVRIVTQYQPAELDGEAANDAVDRLLFDALDQYFTIDGFGFDEFRTAGDGITQWGIVSSEQVNESISSEMTQNSIIAVLIALVAIGFYIAIRFRRWQWAMGATVALAHNALLVIGIFSMLYAVMPFNLEVNQAFIAAILTIIGYSINDTVVIFDRIREYLGLYPKRDLKSNIDNAICATLSRTINTSGTTLVTLLAIFIFGGETIRGFVFALILGVIIGTYSSVFIATPIAYDLQRKKALKGEGEAKAE
jgi:SecD/SecF fusion protein